MSSIHLTSKLYKTISQDPQSKTYNYLPWIIFLDIFQTGIIFLHAHPSILYYNYLCYVSSISVHLFKEELCLQEIWTDGRTGWFLITLNNLYLQGQNILLLWLNSNIFTPRICVLCQQMIFSMQTDLSVYRFTSSGAFDNLSIADLCTGFILTWFC